MGYPNQALANDIKPIRDDMILAGPAFTIKGIGDYNDDTDMRANRINLFSNMKQFGVPLIYVRESGGDKIVAHYGEMTAALGRACGVVGALIDGGTRDTGFLLKQDFPVFSEYRSPVEAFGRWSYYQWQIPVALRGALTKVVMVRPGDFVFGDLDGVVIIPREIVVDVLQRTETLVNDENTDRSDYESGIDPTEVYRRRGRL